MNKKYLLSALVILFVILFIILFIYYNIDTKDKQNKDKNIYETKLLDQPYIRCINNHPTKNDTKLYEIYIDYSENRDSNKYLTKHKRNNSSIGPANIFVIRHAERDNNDVPLNHNGILRSIFHIDLIKGFNDLGYGIDYIVTVNSDLNSGNMHMQQSVFMMSWMLNIPLFIFGSEKQPELAITQVYKNVIFNNKNILFCWEHTCIQELISGIIKIGPTIKKIPNQAFLNKNGKLELPYWSKNNYQAIIHIDDTFKGHMYYTGVNTCSADENLHFKFGKEQTCKSDELPLNF